MMIIIYSLVFLYFFYFDLMPLIKKKDEYFKLVIFNSLIMLLSFIIVIFVGLDLNFPNPSNLIEGIVTRLIQVH